MAAWRKGKSYLRMMNVFLSFLVRSLKHHENTQRFGAAVALSFILRHTALRALSRRAVAAAIFCCLCPRCAVDIHSPKRYACCGCEDRSRRQRARFFLGCDSPPPNLRALLSRPRASARIQRKGHVGCMPPVSGRVPPVSTARLPVSGRVPPVPRRVPPVSLQATCPNHLNLCRPLYLFPEGRKVDKRYIQGFQAEQHALLLDKLKRLDSMVLIFWRASPLYEEQLQDWHLKIYMLSSQFSPVEVCA